LRLGAGGYASSILVARLYPSQSTTYAFFEHVKSRVSTIWANLQQWALDVAIAEIVGLICAISFLIFLTVLHPDKSAPTKFLKILLFAHLALPCAIAATAKVIELWPRLCTVTCLILGSPVGKLGFSLFAGFISFVADLYVRNEIYAMTGENPEAFTSARIALAVPFTIFLLLGVIFLCAYVSVLYHPVKGTALSTAWSLRSLFNSRRQLFPPKDEMRHWFGSFGLFVLLCLGIISLSDNGSELELEFERLMVFTGFYFVPNGRYPTLHPNSWVAFLPGDQICVAESLPNGKFTFRTIPRITALGLRRGD
jgi:hypothetical protein